MPAMKAERVPVEKNAPGRFIESHIKAGGIVVTDDNALTASCLNKDALTIDSGGCALRRIPGSGKVERKDVRRMKQDSFVSCKKKVRARRFRDSLRRMVGCREVASVSPVPGTGDRTAPQLDAALSEIIANR